MRIQNSAWQGTFGYWQSLFIHQHLLMIGHTAWNGYLKAGRGLVVCEIADVISPSIDWSVETVAFDQAFIPQAEIKQYLQAFELETEAVTALLAAVSTYNPAETVAISILGNGAVHINLLQRLKISPRDCHSQVQRRWAEFHPPAAPLNYEKARKN
ncbi:hypothetical protein C1752_04358 [Acaryochloris thomasi RCC1774]|uniref:Uncharacterized protein n=1 Tax=Acaryochloris thomasi RCC1774 TaxID=1764569 RepID=A0A2W1JDJ5_9CYAN|nr:hypothetical protein [Acaryochloris thomasi]PZD71970.1 hypothetical protein C1752_04358 [Acaryochloris thomasi RCC1774]